MPQRFVGADREQAFLMPPSVREWLPEGHLAWFVLDAVGQLDLAAFYAAYRQDGQGRPAHDPAVMVALLLYGYAVGERSSRRIERRCVEDVATRVVAANSTPDHTTISRFRGRFAQELAALFSDVLVLCARAGLVRAGVVAIDGTKLAADASLGANRGVEALREHAAGVLEEAAAADAREDELFGQRRGDELPDEVADPVTRPGRIRQLLDELEAERAAAEAAQTAKVDAYEQTVRETGRRPEGRPPTRELPAAARRTLRDKVNLTDPDSRVVRDRGALIQGYNAQAAVADGQVIVAARIAEDAVDARQLEPMVRAAQHELHAAGIEQDVEQVLADGGYWNSAQMTALAAEQIQTLIPPGRDWRTDRRRKPRRGPHAERIDRLLASADGARRYRRRQQIVEPVFAHIKHLRGLTRFSRRGKRAVQAEWQLIAATHNLLKLYRAPLPAS